MDWKERGPWPGKSVASQEVELQGTFETISLVISQVRKLRLKEGSAKLRLTRPVSCVPALTRPSARPTSGLSASPRACGPGCFFK